MGDILMTLAQCVGKYITYTRSLAVRYCQAVACRFAAAKICGRTYTDGHRVAQNKAACSNNKADRGPTGFLGSLDRQGSHLLATSPLCARWPIFTITIC